MTNTKEDILNTLLSMINSDIDEPVYIKDDPKFAIIAGADICFTGTLKNYTRDTATTACHFVGLSVKPHPTKSTQYLVVGDKTASASKIDKAVANGTIILTEEDFEFLLSSLEKNVE